MNCRVYANLLARVVALLFLTAPGALEAYAQGPSDVLGTLSARAHVGTEANVLLSGIIISGSEPKRVLIRGLGPSLAVSAPLADPLIELRDTTGEVVRLNNNWKDTEQAEIVATGYAPPNDAESAILATLAPGHYTAVLRSAAAGTGVGKLEVIDIDTTNASRLDNSSSRAVVAAGENALVGGFVINGPQHRKVLIRGIGPSLSFYADNALRDPTLTLRDSSGNALVFNDDWEDTQRDAIIESTLPPTERRESAILVTLAPGSYTAELIGACSAGGLALVEIHDLGADTGPVAMPPSSGLSICFTKWAAEQGLADAAAAPTADPDGDGILNLLEYALGRNPNMADGSAISQGTVVVQGQKYLSFSYTRPSGDEAPQDIIYTPERATLLAPANWSAASTLVITHSVTPGPGTLETVTVRSTRPVGAAAREFLRLRVTLTAP